ncbi:MAG: hypothetical protein ACRD4W_03550 [Nitrososphaeraceae archaeon]
MNGLSRIGMPAAISEPIKSKVIEQWIQGRSRDSIATANNISTGAASNIVRGWADKLGKDLVQGLRELYGLLNREGLSPAQCAIGFRTMKVFSDQGVDAETAEHYISDLYKRCNSLGITPEKIVTHTEDLVRFSENMRLPEIEGYVHKKLAQNKELDDKNEQLSRSIVALEAKKSELEKSSDMVLEQSRKVEEEMKSYLGSKQVLDKFGISMTKDTPKFASTVRCIAEKGYDPQKVIKEFEDIHYLQDKRRALSIAADEKQKSLAKLDRQNSSLLEAISLHSHKLYVYNDLDNAGFGLRELQRLLDTILNIMNSNNISNWLAVDKFIRDIETQYDAKLGLESEKEKLNMQIQILKEEREKRLENLRIQPFVGPTIASLIQIGLTENDILKFAEVYLNIMNRSYSTQDLARGMIKTLEVMTSSHTRTTGDDNAMEILGKVREDLSKLDYF